MHCDNMFKIGHYYKGINVDGTTIVYKVLNTLGNTVNIKVVIDHDKNRNTHFNQSLTTKIYVNAEIKKYKENRWITKAKDITDSAELLAIVL